MSDSPAEQSVDAAGPAIVTDERSGRRYVSIYLYERQFEAEFDEAARFLHHRYGTATERYAWLIGAAIWLLLTLTAQGLSLAASALKLSPGAVMVLQLVLVAALAVLFGLSLRWTFGGQERFRKRLVEQRLCFECGYALIGQDVDEHGIGRCPECGTSFNITRYLRPPKRYHRLAPY